jgi:hypothetical protein
MIQTYKKLIPGKVYKLVKGRLIFQLFRYQSEIIIIDSSLCEWPEIKDTIDFNLNLPFLVLEKVETSIQVSRLPVAFIKILVENQNIWWMEVDDEYFKAGGFKFKEIK